MMDDRIAAAGGKVAAVVRVMAVVTVGVKKVGGRRKEAVGPPQRPFGYKVLRADQ